MVFCEGTFATLNSTRSKLVLRSSQHGAEVFSKGGSDELEARQNEENAGNGEISPCRWLRPSKEAKNNVKDPLTCP